MLPEVGWQMPDVGRGDVQRVYGPLWLRQDDIVREIRDGSKRPLPARWLRWQSNRPGPDPGRGGTGGGAAG